MNLLMCLNDGYVYPLINLMHSIRKYNSDKINLFVLSTKLGQSSQELIKEKLGQMNIDLNISIVEVKQFEVAKNQHYTFDMFLRVFAFNILPKNVDKILYLDADMIAVDDISKIYNTDLENKLFGVVRDFGVKFKKVKKYVDSLNVGHTYFNSGMILMNISKMREKWNIAQIEQFIKDNGARYSCPDQDVLNLLSKKEELVFFDDGFNFQIKNNEKLKYDKVVLIHYVGYNKPWNHLLLSRHEKLFWKNYDELNLPEFYKQRKIFRRKRIKMIFYKIVIKIKKIFKKNRV